MSNAMSFMDAFDFVKGLTAELDHYKQLYKDKVETADNYLERARLDC